MAFRFSQQECRTTDHDQAECDGEEFGQGSIGQSQLPRAPQTESLFQMISTVVNVVGETQRQAKVIGAVIHARRQ